MFFNYCFKQPRTKKTANPTRLDTCTGLTV